MHNFSKTQKWSDRPIKIEYFNISSKLETRNLGLGPRA